MAAICVPYMSGQPSRSGRSTARPTAARSAGAHRTQTSTRGLRRYLPGAATLVVVGGVWLGASALAGSGASTARLAQVPATSLVAGEHYIVRPGDTLQSIALRLEPTADPRPVVALLSMQLQGAPLRAGDHLTLP